LVNGEPDPLQPANEINSFVSPAVASVLALAMSQNRERRYASAAKMRKALTDAIAGISEGTLAGGETTVMNSAAQTGSGEAATVLFDSAPATVQSPQVSQPVMAGTAVGTVHHGETTVQRIPDAPRKRRVGPWAIAAGVLCLVAIVFGGLYAYQKSNTAAVPAPSASPDPTPAPVMAAEPAAGGVSEETRADAAKPRVTEELARKKPANEKSAEKATAEQTENPLIFGGVKVMPHPDTGQAPNQVAPPARQVPEVPKMGERRQVPQGASTRSFPDGTQIVTHPDGTRVVIMPNGATRVFRPGTTLPRRRRLP